MPTRTKIKFVVVHGPPALPAQTDKPAWEKTVLGCHAGTVFLTSKIVREPDTTP